MKKFLLLQIRPEDAASDNEYEAFMKFGGLTPDDVHRVRMEQNGIPSINLDDYSGVMQGGGPGNVSDPLEKKTDYQQKYETDLKKLFDQIIDGDFPYIGACYGIGALTNHLGGVVSKENYTEPVGAIDVTLTEAGESDHLLKDIPKQFRAFVGHKEACQGLPEGAKLLASSNTCPVQMIRIKNNIYGCQFHPELDTEGLIVRVNVYKNAGYFPPEEAEPLIQQVLSENVIHPQKILKNFVKRYKKD
ncbi:glutamine amidotransferase [Candidatus Uhrbacteria bacterium]|nr:glutamine amidotransferase [Candidatus Uhrbacteria bacterium]